MFIYHCHSDKDVSQQLRRGFRVLKRDAWPSFICECEPNNYKGGYNGAMFINLWNGTMLLCLHAFKCFFKSAVWKLACKRVIWEHKQLKCCFACKSSTQGSESVFIHAVTHICSPESPHQKAHCPPPPTSVSPILCPLSFFSSMLTSLNQALLGFLYNPDLTVSDSLATPTFLTSWTSQKCETSSTYSVTHSSSREVKTWRVRSLCMETPLHLNQSAGGKKQVTKRGKQEFNLSSPTPIYETETFIEYE